MTKLLNPDGTPNSPAIMAELERRTGGDAKRMAFHANQLAQEVAAQQWPILEKLIAAEWTPEERARYDELHDLAKAQPITGEGNRRFDELAAEARGIYVRVKERAWEKFPTNFHPFSPLGSDEEQSK